jgi:hypothetical protein
VDVNGYVAVEIWTLNGGLPSGAATASGVRLLVFGGDHVDSGAATGTLNPSRVMSSASSTRQPVNRRGRGIRRKTWETALDGAVNKRFLSTGETRELVPDNVGFGLNPGVELAPRRSLLSNWRDPRACKNLRNVADTGEPGCQRCRQDNGRGNFVRGRYGSPAWIRTTIHGSKGRCPTIRRPGSTSGECYT